MRDAREQKTKTRTRVKIQVLLQRAINKIEAYSVESLVRLLVYLGRWAQRSGAELANTTSGLDSLLGDLGEFLGSNNAGDVGEATGSENLEEALHKQDYY